MSDNDEIKSHFRQILGRELPNDGERHFMGLIKKGISLNTIKESITSSPEALHLKTKKYMNNYPKFTSKFSEKEIQTKIQTVKYPYHAFIVGNISNLNSRTTAGYQMWAAQAIPLDLSGKTILDIGAADGFYSFMCEFRGAKKVVAVDIIEFEGFKIWKEILNSNVEHHILQIEELNKLGESFDYVICFGVYYHLPDVVKAIQRIYEKTTIDTFLAGHIVDNKEPIMCYYDKYEMHPEDASNWWVASESCLNQIAKRIGFSKAELVNKMIFDNSFQSSEMKNSVRALKNVGTFKFSK